MDPDALTKAGAVEDRSQEATRKYMVCLRLRDGADEVDLNPPRYPLLPSCPPLNHAVLRPIPLPDDYAHVDVPLLTSICVASLLGHQTAAVPE